MSEIQIGSIVFTDWRVIRKIGKGQFSDVYLIERDTNIMGEKTRSALKVIHVEENSNPRFRRKIEEEAAIMNRFRSHLNIVYYEDFQYLPDPDSGDRYAVFLIKMELLSSLSKSNRIWNTDEIVKMGIDICNALETCEQEHIIHRDIKPQNIFYSDFGDFELGDFGCAVIADQPVLGIAGTFAYMAPEVALKHRYTHVVDLYSLAMVLYQYLNYNQLPFMTNSVDAVTKDEIETANQMRFGGNKIPEILGIHPGLNYVLQKALAFRPEERYQTAGEFKSDLMNYQNLPPKVDMPVEPIEEEPKPEGVKSPKWLIALCVSLIMVVIGIGGYFGWSVISGSSGPKVDSCEGMNIFGEEFEAYRNKLIKKGYNVEIQPDAVGNVSEAGNITSHDSAYDEEAKKNYTITYYYVSAPDVTNLPQDTARNMLEASGWNYTVVLQYDCIDNPVDEGYVVSEELDENDPATVILHVYSTK